MARSLAARRRGARAGARAPVGTARRAGLAVALGDLLHVAGGLSPRVALLGLAAVAVWAALWPSDETDRACARGRCRPADRSAATAPVAHGGRRRAGARRRARHAGYVLHANRMAEDLFGTRRRGGHVASMSRDPELLDGGRPGARLRRDGRSSSCTSACRSSGDCWRRSLRSTSRGPGAAGPALLISFRDLSEQDRLARMRADFVANASHELRTPLASLGASSRRCKGRPRTTPQARERFLKVMSEQAERMTRLVDDLLSLVARGDARASAARRARRSQRCGGARHPGPAADRRPGRHHDRVSPAGSARRHPRRPRRDRAGVPEPGAERHQVRQAAAAASTCASTREAAGGGRPARFVVVGDGRRARHRPAAPAAPHRALLPRERGGEPREGRHRAWASPSSSTSSTAIAAS